MSSLANTTLSFKSFCKVDFSGGDLSSNCGLLLMGQFMDNMGITSFLKENFFDDPQRLKRHNDADILLQLMACFKTGHLVVTNALKQQKTTPVCSV